MMGTSTSSSGPGPNVPLDPPWLDEYLDQEDQKGNDEIEEPQKESTPDIAPERRFLGARSSLGKWARDGGGRENFNRAMGHYSKTGMGGASRVAGRLQASSVNAGRLATFLGNASAGKDSDIASWVSEITSKGLSSNEIIDAIIQRIAPSRGSREDESAADSMARAMSEFIEKNPEENLFELTESNIREITELFIANEAYSRLINDIGQILERNQLTPRESIALTKEMKAYLYADISTQIDSLWTEGRNPTQRQLERILTSSIENTFLVYEDGI